MTYQPFSRKRPTNPEEVEDVRPVSMGECIAFVAKDEAPPDATTIMTARSHPSKTEELGAGCIMFRHGKKGITLWIRDESDFASVEAVVKDLREAASR